MVTLEVLSLGSYEATPAPSQPFKAILERFVWIGHQNCHRIILDKLSVIKMSSFQYFLSLRVKREGIGSHIR